jgi:hypothetical protein
MSIFLREPDDPTTLYSFDILPTKSSAAPNPALPWQVEVILREGHVALATLSWYADKVQARLAADAFIKTWLDARLP